jgi:hypothetical protein
MGSRLVAGLAIACGVVMLSARPRNPSSQALIVPSDLFPVTAVAVDTPSMPSKRTAARQEAAETIDLESRLAPFFPDPPVGDAHARTDDGHTFDD